MSFLHRDLGIINRQLFIRAPWHVRLKRWIRKQMFGRVK